MPMRGTGQGAATVNSASGGIALAQVLYGAAELVAWGYCSFQQLITTHDSIVSIMQGGILTPSHMTPQQLLYFLAGTSSKFNAIGWTVAFVTQIIYWGAALPGAPIRNRILHRIIVAGFIILEIITDLWYSMANNTTLGGAVVFVFNFANGGWLVSLCYIAAMSAGSIFLGVRGINRLATALGPVFRSNNAA